jgi:hypothetical protein
MTLTWPRIRTTRFDTYIAELDLSMIHNRQSAMGAYLSDIWYRAHAEA